ncbi:glycine betaine ABC transporter substrate-binding protein [Nocardiopsis sp. HNM0947]|uniref:Glycine betaine ABC transporter substrate-binding protein n=1 Tax=Nocardiopsis coralli TaxID=2772213 RepID=A0ABR9P3B2_9ACTN|nr:glycine betaine ABC transporter substrate-binding protein [Nocardiopsis coralli]MBE2998323.1 glycine betaine ABC transporter substrate-binding protein [Nocardiopsis coralli]
MYSHRRLTGLAAAGMSGALLLTACGGGAEDLTGENGEAAEDGQSIDLAMIAWDDSIAVTSLWAVILEEKGYDVDITELDVAPAFQGLENGDVDAYLGVWLPVTHEEYWEDYGENLESLGVWYDNAVLTLTVPSYMEDVNEIPDLVDHADELGNRIVGIDPGAGLTRVTEEEAMPGYELEDDFELVTSSDAAMQAELDAAVAEEEPIVVTLWRPHSAYAQHDLKDLEDPAAYMGEAEDLHAVGREGFRDEYPALTGWIDEWDMSDTELADLAGLTLVEHEGDPQEGAREWLSQNPEFLERTLGEDAEGLEF